jgi:tetratricopeptide (TPR) repeat protein
MLTRISSVIVLVALTAACSGSEPAARRFVDRGDEFLAAGRFDAAVIEYRNAIKKRPTWSEAYRKLGDVYTEQGKGEDAYRSYSNAADFDPADVHSHVEAGRLLLSARRFTEALARAEQALAREAQRVDAQILAGLSLAGLRRFDEAIAQLDAAVAVDRRSSAYVALGEAKRAAGDRAGAERAFRAGLDREPTSIDARVALAEYFSTTDRSGEAEQQLLQLVAANPSSEVANRAAARFYLSAHREAAAEPFLKAAARQPKQKLKSTLALADYYSAAHRYQDARTVLEEIAGGPLQSAAKVRLAAIELETGSPENARRLLDEILKKRPTGDAWTVNAQLLQRERKPDEALSSARAAINLDPEIAAAHYVIGTIELERGHLNEAERSFREVLRLRRLIPGASLQLARTTLAQGRARAAIELAEAAGPELDARLTLARALIADGQVPRARTELRRLEAASGNSPEPAILLGSLELRDGDMPSARAHAARALALAPDGPDALRLAAQAAMASNDTATAEQYLTRAIARDPSSFEGHGMLAQLYAERGDLERARVTLEQFAASHLDTAAPHTALGIVLEAAGRPDEARKRYEEAVKLDPGEPVASNNLARLYAADETRLDRAMDLARKAVDRLPKDPDVHDTLGWVAFRAGRLTLAAAELEAAVALNGQEPTYRNHLQAVRRAIEAAARAEARAETEAAQRRDRQRAIDAQARAEAEAQPRK